MKSLIRHDYSCPLSERLNADTPNRYDSWPGVAARCVGKEDWADKGFDEQQYFTDTVASSTACASRYPVASWTGEAAIGLEPIKL